jgi:hypothetical protein
VRGTESEPGVVKTHSDDIPTPHPVTSSVKTVPGSDPRIRRRIQIGMFRPIRVDHTKCLQVANKTHSHASDSCPMKFE